MAREVYGQTDVPIAPPRIALQMFGGPYSIEAFRDKPISAMLLSPPFITSYMVVEERQNISNASSYALNATGTVKGLRRPAKPVPMIHAPPPPANESPYEIYSQGKKETVKKTTPVAEKKETRKNKANNDKPGTLNAFML